MAETIDEMMARVTALQQPVNPSEFSGALGAVGRTRGTSTSSQNAG